VQAQGFIVYAEHLYMGEVLRKLEADTDLEGGGGGGGGERRRRKRRRRSRREEEHDLRQGERCIEVFASLTDL